jgi:flagellar biosynthetic protein FliR
VPARTRILLAVALTALVAPLMPETGIAPFSAQGLVVVAQQLLIGIALGFALQIVFDSLGLAGQLLANSMGLSFAFNVDPLRGSSTAALGQLYIILATLVFLALNGHLALLEVLTSGFTTMPVGTTGLGPEGIWSLVLWGGQLFAGAISIALPGITALLIVNLAFGVVSRAAPALNLFAVGFPVSLVIGLLVVLAGMGPLIEGVTRLLAHGFEFLRALSGG